MTALASVTIIQLGPVRQVIEPYLDLLLPFFFVGFYLAALVALVFNTDPRVRKTYVTGLFILVLFVNLVGVTVVPLTHWQKFTQLYDEEQTDLEIRIVDAEGHELHYDHRATLAVDGVTIFILQQELAEERPREEKVKRARFLLERAIEYRQRIESRQLVRYVRFPPHGLDNIWTRERLDGYGEFVGIRLYRLDIVTSEDGRQLASVSETLVMEYIDEERAGLNSNVANGTSAKRPVNEQW